MRLWVAGGGAGSGQNLKLVTEGSGEGEKSQAGMSGKEKWQGQCLGRQILPASI